MNDLMAQQILNFHNRYRAEVGVQPLQWSDDLARQAGEWTNYLTATRSFTHSGAKGEGENIWMGTSHAHSFGQMIDSFGNEKQRFRPGFSRTSATQEAGSTLGITHRWYGATPPMWEPPVLTARMAITASSAGTHRQATTWGGRFIKRQAWPSIDSIGAVA